LSKTAAAKKQTIQRPKNLNLLNTFPFESGFHFYTELGKYTGITACSTVEFAEKLQIVPIESVTFHFQRQDFRKWFKNTIGDVELATRIDQIMAEPSGEYLRKDLFKMVHHRITELQHSYNL
jgi:alpha-amylase